MQKMNSIQVYKFKKLLFQWPQLTVIILAEFSTHVPNQNPYKQNDLILFLVIDILPMHGE